MLLCIPPLKIIVLFRRHTLSRKARPTPETRQHSFIIRRKIIQHVQLPLTKPFRNNPHTPRYQSNDKHREPDSSNSLRDSHTSSHPEHLTRYPEENLPSSNSEQRFITLHEPILQEEENGFPHNPIRPNRPPANREEHPRKHRRRHGMQHDQQRPRHGAYNAQAHDEVRDALLDHRDGFGD